MLKAMLIGGAMALAAPALAQTTTDPTGTTDTTGTAATNETDAAVMDDAATTQRTGETDLGTSTETGAATAARGGPFQAAGDYPPCTRTRTDRCTQTRERRRR